MQKIIILLIVLFISITACKNKAKTELKAESRVIPLTLISTDSLDLKLTKIYDIGTLNMQDVEVKLRENKKFTIQEKLDKLFLCYAISDHGAVPFYIGPDMDRRMEVMKNDEGNLELIFDKEDHINNFTKKFHEKLGALFSIEGDENECLIALNQSEINYLNQLEAIKPKLNNTSYSTLKAMVSGKMAHFKFMLSDRFKSLTPQSSYYDFTDNLEFDNDNYLIYSDNLNTIFNTLEIQYERKYNSPLADASNKLEFINESIKNDEVRSQFMSVFLSKDIPEKTEQDKQVMLTKLKGMKIKDTYFQHISSIEAGTALGTKIGNKAKYLETLISRNKDFNIESLTGKIVYIDNWATWCGPCMKSMQSFLKKYNELKKVEDVVFVFVSFDRKESIWLNYLKKVNFPEEKIVHLYNGPDMKSTYGNYYNIGGLPRYFVTNKAGMISDLDPSTPLDENFEHFIKNQLVITE